MNEVILIGRLTRDPEMRYTQREKAVCSFTLAVDRGGQNGTDFIRVKAWNKQAENCGQFLHKGSMAAVAGSIRTDNYEKDGQRVNTFEILANRVKFLSSPQGQEAAPRDYGPRDLFQEIQEELPF